jgi:hypothetical protein
MSIYTYSQKSFDKQNLNLSHFFDVEYVQIELTDDERTIERIPNTRFRNPGSSEASKKAAETKRRLGIPLGPYGEFAKKRTQTLVDKYGSLEALTSHMQTKECLSKSKQTCKALAERSIVEELRQLSKRYQIKLGSGWVRKPDHWILEQIDLIKDRIVVP